jgi:iron complex outermembrane recepter protein
MIKKKSLLVLLGIMLIYSSLVFGQKDSVRTVVLSPVYVTETKPTFKTTSREVVAITNSEMKETGAQTLSQAISTLPGVSQITTGAISKPVIRGLYGDRIQINVAGLKLEDQQWEDEHGLGLSDVGVERIELIKGPASLMFGSGAMGGVVNIVEESLPDQGTSRHNLNFKLFSNTYGVGADYGFKKAARNTFILRTGVESHADYSDGSGKVVPNTRFAMYNLNLGYIVNHEKFRSENRLMASFNQFGFIADSADLFEVESEGRLDREFEEAHHTVLFLLYSSINTLDLNDKTQLNFTVGLQNNLRQEQERGDEVEMNILLNTFSLNASLKTRLNQSFTITNGVAGMFQMNRNFAERIIVPDAALGEASLYSYVSHRHQAGIMNGTFEAGIRYDHKQVATHETESDMSIISTQPPFNKGFENLNGSIGESLSLKNLLLKFNLSSGFRTGNLSELAANGLHEGSPFWYVGNPFMKPERCLNTDVSANYNIGWLSLRGSVFHNKFKNFIYLRPTDEEMFGFNIYRYDQSDATLKGFEAGVSLENKEHFSVSADYAYLDARRGDGTWLPFIPANRLIIDSKYNIKTKNKDFSNAFLSLGANYTVRQDRIDSNENITPGYFLLNAGAGLTYKSVRFLLTCRNLTNTKYFDHLSRLKYYGLNDMGRNIILNIGWQF